MNRGEKARFNLFLRYLLLIGLGIVMTYPLYWMMGASFKTNPELFSSAEIILMAPTLDEYRSGFKSYGGTDLLHFMGNTYKFVLPKVVSTVISAITIFYGFARLRFVDKNLLFALLLSTLFLPQVVLGVPRYILFNETGRLNSYLPIVIPFTLAGDMLLVYMLIQSLRGVPGELGETTEIDRYNAVERLRYVIASMLRPSIILCALFQFMRASNGFMGPLIYTNPVCKHPVFILLRVPTDTETGFDWNRILTIPLSAIILSLVVFFMTQNPFVDGIAIDGAEG